jgi:4-amino-4-deoxy-L-arabinose transferase-like glycosyltransferase
VVAVSTLVLLLATEPYLAIAWDEGYTLGREERVRAWFRALRDPSAFATSWHPVRPEMIEDAVPPPRRDEIDTRAKLFEPRVLAWFWPFAREEPHGHPPFYAIVGMLGDVLTPSWDLLPRARLGTILAFSLTAGALSAFVASRWGLWPAALASGAWVLQPRLFAEGHYATYDALLACLWVGSILAFAKAVEGKDGSQAKVPRWRWVVMFGLLAGWAADTKLTGWFLPLPFLAWTALYRDRRGVLTLWVGGVIALVTLYAFNPPWWAAPIAGIGRFLQSNLTRAQTRPIPILFLGRIIETPTGSLPWYNTLVWTVFVTPVGFLSLALLEVLALVSSFRLASSSPSPPVGEGRSGGARNSSRRPCPPTLTLPHQGGGDRNKEGVKQRAPLEIQRQFSTQHSALSTEAKRPALNTHRFAVLALGHWIFLLALRALPHTPGHDGVRQFLPAFGVLGLVAGLGAAEALERWGMWGKAWIGASLAEAAVSVAVMMPVPLSYYSPIVGGLSSATALGMESTYYWDALSEETLAWLNDHTRDGEKVAFATYPTSWLYLQRTGQLRVRIFPWERGRWAWYVLQNRPGAFSELDRELAARGRPSRVVRKWSVPLIWIFPWSEYEAAARRVEARREGPR